MVNSTRQLEQVFQISPAVLALYIKNVQKQTIVLIMVGRWHRRMENKLDEIREYARGFPTVTMSFI